MSETGTTTANLNLRAGPSTAAAIHETLKSGTRLAILARQGEWLSVRVEGTGREGFVHGSYVRLPSPEIVSGFLAQDAEVAAVPLAPSARKQAPSGAGDASRTAARIWNAYGGLLSTLAARLGFEPETGVAVMAVESGGSAFVEGRMVIRFENHVFFDRWGKAHRETFDRHFRFSATERWKGHEFRAAADQAWKSFHGRQAGEWEVLTFAEKLDRVAARESISMGLPQIMGFNAAGIGYAGVDAMFAAFGDPATGERAQVVGMFDFIKGARSTSPMVEALRSRDWAAFARRYNGPGQAEVYGGRLKSAYEAAKALVPG
jgi:hypothetical protein